MEHLSIHTTRSSNGAPRAARIGEPWGAEEGALDGGAFPKISGASLAHLTAGRVGGLEVSVGAPAGARHED